MPWLTRLSILALFIVAASAAWWLDTTREPERDAIPDAATAGLPDYYLADFRISRYVDEGQPRQVLDGERLDHYPGTDSAEVRRPRLTHQAMSAPVWDARGDHGTLLQQTDVVELRGNVRLHRRGGGQVREFTLLTPQLTYEMGPEVARTEQPVRMFSAGTRVTATGMTARLDVEEVELLDDVRVTHDPALAAGAPGDD